MIKFILLLFLFVSISTQVQDPNKEFLAFLEDYIQPVQNMNTTSKEETSSLKDRIEVEPTPDKKLIAFIRGFIEGTDVIDFLPSLKTCRPLDDDLVCLIDKLFITLRNITIHNIEEMVKKAVEIGYDILDQAKISLKGCPKFRDEVILLLKFIEKYVSEKGYLEKILIHGMVNRAIIMKQIQTMRKFIIDGDDFRGGKEGGKLFIYIFFYDADKNKN